MSTRHFFLTICIIAVLFAVYASADELTWEEHAAQSHAYFKYRKFKHLSKALEEYSIFENEETFANGVAVADHSTAISVESFKCLRNNGFVASIPRAYMQVNRIDPVYPQTVKNAQAAGFQYVDVYMFPCPTCGDPEGQFNRLWASFSDYHINIGMVWIDVEDAHSWADANSNINFLTRLLSRAKTIGANIGIYANRYQWTSIFGNWNCPSSYPIWFPNYNGSTSCAAFQSFGGFNSAVLHQFQGTTYSCGAGIDISSYC